MNRFFQPEGGRIRPPFCTKSNLSFGARWKINIQRTLLALLLGAAAATCGSRTAVGQAKSSGIQRKRMRALVIQQRAIRQQQRFMTGAVANKRPPAFYPNAQVIRPAVRENRIVRPMPLDNAALDLLKKMIRPDADYFGVQVTELTVRGKIERTEQNIWGNKNGWVRRDYLSPVEMHNDTMLTGPRQYRYYHARKRIQDIALWPTEWNEKEKRFLKEIRTGRIAIAFAGYETIAGMNAVKIRISPNAQSNEGTVQFWIDPSTGIQLKTAKYDPAGSLMSQSYLTALTVGPVDPNLFKVGWPTADVNPLFPLPQFGNLEAARAFLPFQPLEPSPIPTGFQPRGVWVFSPKAVLLRYTDGLATFSLYEHPAGPLKNPNAFVVPPRMYGRNLQRWRISVPTGDIEVDYIGHLSASEAQAMHDSLK